MQPRAHLTRTLLAITFVGFALFLSFTIYLSFIKPAQSASTNIVSKTTTHAALMNSGLPVRLKIPKINIDATFEYVGLTSDGAMDIPKRPGEVAWFNLGPLPGDIGSAVIAGHEGWKDGISAVFDNLHSLQKGDIVSVVDEKGVITTFVVREIRTFVESGNALDVFFSNDGKAHLNLITCQGIWNKTKQSYSNRLVVFTDKIES